MIDKAMYNKNDLYRSISLLRLPMALLVILMHCNFLNRKTIPLGDAVYTFENCRFVDTCIITFSEIIACVAVPLFFAISGFLFFNKVESFTWTIYKKKLSRRLKTLVLPYFIWNIIAITAFYHKSLLALCTGGQTEFNLMYAFSRLFINPNNFSIYDISHPAVFSFWFVRDLICLMILSPVIYQFCKRLNIIYLWGGVILWFFGIIPANIPGLSAIGLCFFSIGAYLAIHKIEITNFAEKKSILTFLSIALISLIVIDASMLDYKTTEDGIFLKVGNPMLGQYIRNTYRLLSVIFFVLMTIRLNRRIKIRDSILEDSAGWSFFMFAFHCFIIFRIENILVFIYNQLTNSMIISPIGVLIIYVLTFFTTVGISLLMAWLCCRNKHLKTILTGGR